MHIKIEQIKSAFCRVFDTEPDFVIQAPGRINLIGEHIDYNGGLVLPAAIDRYVWMSFGQSKTPGIFEFYSVDFDESYILDNRTIEKSDKGWVNFFLGIIKQLYPVINKQKGLRVAFTSNIPMGAGMSSSSAIEGAFLFGINYRYQLGFSYDKLIAISQWSNHNFLGIQGGIMDQFTSFNGRKGHCILLDCATYNKEYIPLTIPGYKWVLFDTKVKHDHATGSYNSGPEACKQALQIIQKDYPDIKFLVDLDKKQLSTIKLPKHIKERVAFVLEENQRVLAFVEALRQNSFQQLGHILYQSHAGLQQKYLVSCETLDFLVEISKKTKGIMGARMMGGGFGGCTLNLIREEDLKDVIETVSDQYKKRFSIDMEAYTVAVVDGISFA